MVDTLLKSEPLLRVFFAEKENTPNVVEKDLKQLVAAKLGTSVATMFFASLVAQANALSPEEILADDEKLTRCKSVLASLPVAKKVQTCDTILCFLKENVEFMMLDKEKFRKFKKQLSILVTTLEPSTKLLFAQNIAATSTEEGNNLIELLFDVFERDLIVMLDLSDETRRRIEESD